MRRREFLRVAGLSSAVGLGVHLMPQWARSAVSVGDRVRIGIIGPGGRARGLMLDAPESILVVALADCDTRQLDSFDTWIQDARPDLVEGPLRKYQDYAELLAKEKLDGVIVATTTHARALICIHAMQAGLDVYAEKPLALTIEEGQYLIRAEKKYRSILQVGTQQRSIPINNFASDLVLNGKLGKIQTVHCTNFLSSEFGRPSTEAPVPKEMNWDAWCHQTELVPFSPDLHPGLGLWGRWRPYDGGGLVYGVTGWGTHAFDQVQRALGTDDVVPVEVWPTGEGMDSPVTMRYANGITIETILPRDDSSPGLGAVFHGENGNIYLNRNQLVCDPPELREGAPIPDTDDAWASVSKRHIQNWCDSIRTRKPTRTGAVIGHHSTMICILMNICRELGRKITWDPVKEQFVDDPEANAQISRPRRKGYELPAELAKG